MTINDINVGIVLGTESGSNILLQGLEGADGAIVATVSQLSWFALGQGIGNRRLALEGSSLLVIV
jgi:hypothetical protein